MSGDENPAVLASFRLFTHPQRSFTSMTTVKAKRGSSSHGSLSRAERRALERKQRNQERRQARAEAAAAASGGESSSVFGRRMAILQTRLQEFVHPRLAGSGQRIHQDHLWALLMSYRLPLACLLAYMATDSDVAPYTIQASLGPSMLPTIQFIGDLWLVERTTSVWSKWIGLGGESNNNRNHMRLQTGDVVLWKDTTTGRVSCKRIVGMPGDTVRRFGEYAYLYDGEKEQDGEDNSYYGIVWPRKSSKTGDEHPVTSKDWDPAPNDRTVDRTLVVPDGCVWLEGDCPPFSLDSRHYGPIPLDWICGRLILRLWPWNDNVYFQDVPSRQSKCIRTMPRPKPFPSPDDYLGKHFNFYRVPAIQQKQ